VYDDNYRELYGLSSQARYEFTAVLAEKRTFLQNWYEQTSSNPDSQLELGTLRLGPEALPKRAVLVSD